MIRYFSLIAGLHPAIDGLGNGRVTPTAVRLRKKEPLRSLLERGFNLRSRLAGLGPAIHADVR